MKSDEKSAKEKAIELVEKFKPLVYCYAGSGMLTNEANDSIILMNAKSCAAIAINEMIDDLRQSMKVAKELHPHAAGLIAGSIVCWQSVKSELENLK